MKKVLDEALQLYKVERFANQIMGTHWRLMLRTRQRGLPHLFSSPRFSVPPLLRV